MATGLKEAKINVPGEDDPALEGLPVERDILLVEPQESDEPKIPAGAPGYDNVGKIKVPRHDAEEFVEAMDMLRTGHVKSSATKLDANELLESLEDIAHDLYYGSKIAEDPAVLKALFCMLADEGAGAPEGVTPRDQQAGAILAAALQNNPAALKEVVKSWPELMSYKCQGEDVPLSRAFYTPLVNPNLDEDAATAASRASAKIGALNGLIKDDSIRAEFLKNGGMDHVLAVLVPEGKAWASAQRKAGQLALDNFLDEDMGARLGQWPLAQRPSNQQCSGTSSQTSDGCWDYHVERIMKANEGDEEHWSKDLHNRLAALGRKEGDAPHDEL
jgi:nucleotide exchange factor SIL1